MHATCGVNIDLSGVSLLVPVCPVRLSVCLISEC